jgi:hypothetical protein
MRKNYEISEDDMFLFNSGTITYVAALKNRALNIWVEFLVPIQPKKNNTIFVRYEYLATMPSREEKGNQVDREKILDIYFWTFWSF